jgi:hypothetical protein
MAAARLDPVISCADVCYQEVQARVILYVLTQAALRLESRNEVNGRPQVHREGMMDNSNNTTRSREILTLKPCYDAL